MTGHKKDYISIAKVVFFINSSSGNLHQKRTTHGWKILVEWKDDSVDWFPLKGLKNSNPVELAEYTVANEISDGPEFNLWVNPQVDSECHHYQLLTEVNDHKKDDSDKAKVDGFIKSSSWKLHRKRTTRGWKLLLEWKNFSVDWVPLKDLKQSNPVELAEYAVGNEISDEPAFNWWVNETLRHRYRIISKVKYKYCRIPHKFGVQVPKTVK